MAIVSFQEYLNQKPEDVYKDDVLKRYQERKIARNVVSTKNEYKQTIKEYQNILKNAKVDNTLTQLKKTNPPNIVTPNQYLPTASNLQRLESNRTKLEPYQQDLKQLENKSKQAFNNLVKAKYEFNVMNENNSKVTFIDKTIGNLTRPIGDLLSNLSLTENPSTRRYINENGSTEILPSSSDLKQQHVSDSYNTKIGKFAGDTAYNLSKIATASILPGGSALYWTDMFTDNTINAVNEGYNSANAIAYATVSTGLEYLVGKGLGSATKSLTGGATNNYTNLLAKGTSKFFKNPKIASLLANAGSEATEEFVQEYLDNINKLITLEGATNVKDYIDTIGDKDILLSAIYSAGIGAISGGVLNAKGNVFNTFKQELVETRAKETDTNKIVKIDKTISYIDNYLENYNNSKNSNVSSNLIKNSSERLQYLPTANEKINNLNKSASQYFDNSKETTNMINTISKVVKDKNYNVVFDNTIANVNGESVNAKISNVNGEVEIRLNPNSDRAVEFLLSHEITHAIETDSMKKLVLDYASKNSEFNNALESLKQTYGTDDVSSEVLADISGQLLGNQEFINSLSIKNPNIFKKIYNKIIEIANKITGNSKESLFIKDLKNKWEETYRNTTIEQATNNLKNNMYNQKTLSDGTSYFQTEDNLFTKANGTPMTQKEIYNYLVGTTIKFNDGTSAEIVKRLPQTDMYNELFKRLPRAKNINNIKQVNQTINNNIRGLLSNSNDINTKADVDNRHLNQNITDFNTREVMFYDGKEAYTLTLSIGILDNGKRVAYAKKMLKANSTLLNKIKQEGMSSTSNKGRSSQFPQVIDNISQIDNSVNSDTSSTKYSMQESKNNTQELDNSSFSLKEKQNNNKYSISESDLKSKQNDKSWQEHLENNYKAKGTRTQFKNILATNANDLNNEFKPTKNVLAMPKERTSIDEKIENNLKTIADLNKLKDESNNRINLKIKEKRELYQSKKNKNTKLANILQQQAIALENQKKSVEMAYNHRIEALEERNKKINSKEYRINDQRKSKSLQYREEAEELIISDIGNWEDKNAGYKYKRETMERNIKDIIPNKEVSQKVVDEYIKPVYKATATMEKYVTYYNNKIKSLNLSKNESIAVQMLGEGKYNGIKPIESVAVAKGILNGMNSTNDLKQCAQLYLDAVDFIENNNLDINKIESSIKTFREIYDNVFQQVNKVLKDQGYKEMDYRKDYFPHFTKETSDSKIGKIMEKLGWKNKNNNLPTDIAGITDQFKPGKTYFSHANRRYGNITEYNALEGFDTYIRGASEQIYLTEPIQKLRALENEIRYLHSEKGIQEKYEEIINSELDEDSKESQIQLLFQNAKTPLNNFVTELRSYTDNIANKKSELDRRTEHLFNRRIYSTMTNIQSRVSANMVGLNISSALTNFIPITQAWSQISTKNLLKAMKSSIVNSVKSDGFVDNSEFLVNRLQKADRLYKTTLDKVADKTGIFFEAVDDFTSNVIVRGKYFENLEKGMSKTDALKNANDFGRNIMAARDKGSLPTVFNAKNPILKLFTSFQVEVNNQYSYMLKDLPNDLKDEGMKRLVVAFVKMFLGAYLYNLISEKVTGIKSAFSPADMVIDSYKTIENNNIDTYTKISEITKNTVGELPFVGGILGGGRLPISSALPSIPKTTQALINLSDNDKRKNAISELHKELSKPLFYIIPPFAGGQTKKTVEGLGMYAHDIPGSYTTSGKLRFKANTDPLSVAQNAIFGQYSSEEARNYFDNGYTALSEKQQEEFENLDVSMEKYRNYLSDLKEWNNIKSDKDSDGNPIAGTALAKKVYDMMNNKKEYSEQDVNFYLSKLSDTKDPIEFVDISKIDNDVDVYKYYFSLSRESKDEFIEITETYNVSQKKYIDYTEKIKEIDEKYSNLTKNIEDTQEKYKLNAEKKQNIWRYINGLNASKVQKIMFYKKIAGYSITQYKDYMFKYINSLDKTKEEKQKLWKELY